MRKNRRTASRALFAVCDEIKRIDRTICFTWETYYTAAFPKGVSFSVHAHSSFSDPTASRAVQREQLDLKLQALSAAREEKLLLFEELIQYCPEQVREILRDYYLGQKQVKEIVSDRNMSEITVKKRLSLGRDLVFRYLCCKRKEEEKEDAFGNGAL